MKLSKNLSLREVVKSNTAIILGIDNQPKLAHIESLHLIAKNVFQPVRDHFNVPIGITSGYRCKELNKAIGGSKKSQHCKGEALDLDADIYGRITNKQIFDFIKDNLEFDQLINEFDYAWVHVSYSKNNNRRNVLEAKEVKGITNYTNVN